MLDKDEYFWLSLQINSNVPGATKLMSSLKLSKVAGSIFNPKLKHTLGDFFLSLPDDEPIDTCSGVFLLLLLSNER